MFWFWHVSCLNYCSLFMMELLHVILSVLCAYLVMSTCHSNTERLWVFGGETVFTYSIWDWLNCNGAEVTFTAGEKRILSYIVDGNFCHNFVKVERSFFNNIICSFKISPSVDYHHFTVLPYVGGVVSGTMSRCEKLPFIFWDFQSTWLLVKLIV
jgi:hypothetical protein